MVVRRPSAPDRGTTKPSVGRAPGRIVEPHVVADLAVHLEQKLPIATAALLTNGHDRRGRHRGVGANIQIDLVDIDQLA